MEVPTCADCTDTVTLHREAASAAPSSRGKQQLEAQGLTTALRTPQSSGGRSLGEARGSDRPCRRFRALFSISESRRMRRERMEKLSDGRCAPHNWDLPHRVVRSAQAGHTFRSKHCSEPSEREREHTSQKRLLRKRTASKRSAGGARLPCCCAGLGRRRLPPQDMVLAAASF